VNVLPLLFWARVRMGSSELLWQWYERECAVVCCDVCLSLNRVKTLFASCVTCCNNINILIAKGGLEPLQPPPWLRLWLKLKYNQFIQKCTTYDDNWNNITGWISDVVSRLDHFIESWVFRSRVQAYCLETLITATILLRKTSVFHRVFCLLYLKVKNNKSRWE